MGRRQRLILGDATALGGALALPARPAPCRAVLAEQPPTLARRCAVAA